LAISWPSVVAVDVHLDAQMALDPGHGIDDDAFAGLVEIEAVRSLYGHGEIPLAALFVVSVFVADDVDAAIGADAGVRRDRGEQPPAAVAPILSALASTPNALMLVSRS